MKNKYFAIAALTIVSIFGSQAVDAQITITIPGIPKIKKPKIVTTTDTTTSGDSQNDKATDNREDEPSESLDPRLSLFLDELKNAQQDVDKYNPNDYLYLVGGNSTDWLWRAVSARERAEFENKWKSVMTPGAKKRFDDGLTALAASAAKKLPTYKASLNKYTFHNAAEERMMKGVLTKIADYKIFSSGLQEGAWLIDKNDYGLPTARYKHGVIYLRDTKSDHLYCYATYVNVIQDYAGGGTYGASYARFIKDEMVGCPAGK